MKVKVLDVCFGLALSMAASYGLFAQPSHEGLSPRDLQDPNHQELNLNDDKTLLYEPDVKTKTNRDSIVAHARPMLTPIGRSKAGNKPSDDDDALSFNFLYFIIQKFKITDLVDE